MTFSAETPPVRIIRGLSEIADAYDAVLCDVWGVVHNGDASFPAACDALARFRAKGGAVVLITNAPRPGADVALQLVDLGVPRAAYDALITSGDVTVEMVRAHGAAPVHHIGPERDLNLFEEAAAGGVAPRLTDLAGADYVLCTGLFDDDVETVDDYRDTLARMRARSLPFICANPDLVVHRGDKLIYCAGALAQAYEAIGGDVVCAGKPFPPIYKDALTLAEKAAGRPIDRARVLVIGDAMRTDIAGAVDQGLDSLFVSSGIHRHELPTLRDHHGLFARAGLWPTAAIHDLVW